jgi:hypothetical protein
MTMANDDPIDLPWAGKCRCLDPTNLEEILKAGRVILQQRTGSSTKTEDQKDLGDFWL